MIRINLEDIYEPISVAEDLSNMTFSSVDMNAVTNTIKIEIVPLGHSLLPNGDIDDKAKIIHSNTSKVFSTIVCFCLVYLQANPEITIGVDGSDDGRAYLYHRMFQTNRTYLDEYFVSIGVDWYVRLLRNGDIETDMNGTPFFKPKPEPFDYLRNSNDLYRYYMFHLRQL